MLFIILVCKILYTYTVNQTYALSEHSFVSSGIPTILEDNDKDYDSGNLRILVFFVWFCHYYNQDSNIIALSSLISIFLLHEINFTL